MRKVHVYKTGEKLYASAAEVVPAVLKGPFKVVYHGAGLECLTCAITAAIDRAMSYLRYSTARNFQAAEFAAALLLLMYWPLIYNAIPLSELVVAGRIASSICLALSLIAVLRNSIQVHRLAKARTTYTRRVEIVCRNDGLLPSATAWVQDHRRASFPWLGLGLILFSIALNCVIVADYTHPAMLSDGTVRHTVGLALPWTTWENNDRYIIREFVIPFGANDLDPRPVLRISYRARNLNLDTLIPGPEELEYKMLNTAWVLVQRLTDAVRMDKSPNTSDAEMAEEIGSMLASREAFDVLAEWFNTEVFSVYPDLQLEYMKLSVETMSISEFSSVWQKQMREWELR